MRIRPRKVLAALAICFVSALASQQARAQGPIVGNITFAGSVSLDTTSVNTATMVTAWHGLAPGDLPQVQSDDGTFATAGVMPGDATTFHAPWTFNSGPISSFWSVTTGGGFTFDLTASNITHQTGDGSLGVAGTGTVSHSGFTTTPGTFNFTTQDPSASSRFSFSAATAVPESGTAVLFAIGATCLAGSRFLRRRVKGVNHTERFPRISGPLFLP
jgi:hypothetical protein